MGAWTLRQKIVAFVIVIMAAFLVARGVARAHQSYSEYVSSAVGQARRTADTLAVTVADGVYWRHPDRVQEMLLTLQSRMDRSAAAGSVVRESGDIMVVDRSARVVAATNTAMIGVALDSVVRETLARVIERMPAQTFSLAGESTATHWLAVPVEVDGESVGMIAVEYFKDPARLFARSDVLYELLTITIVTLGLVLVLLVGLRKLVLQPLAALEEGAERLGAGDLDARVTLDTGDELETVAEAFHRMARALKTHQARQIAREKQAMLAEVAETTAGELSKPLTVVLGYATLLQEEEPLSSEFLGEAAQSIQRGSYRMAEIIRQLSSMGSLQGMLPASMPVSESVTPKQPRKRA